MASPVSCVHPVAYGESTGGGLCSASCFFPVIYRESASRQAAIVIAYDGSSKGDDLTGVYIQRALPVVQQQLLNGGIRLAKIINKNFSSGRGTPRPAKRELLHTFAD